jgi:hypothetical protein
MCGGKLIFKNDLDEFQPRIPNETDGPLKVHENGLVFIIKLSLTSFNVLSIFKLYNVWEAGSAPVSRRKRGKDSIQLGPLASACLGHSERTNNYIVTAVGLWHGLPYCATNIPFILRIVFKNQSLQ